MNKNFFALIALALFANVAFAQPDPLSSNAQAPKSQVVKEQNVKWTFSSEKVSDTEYVIVSNAILADDWCTYSQKSPEDGPVATSFDYGTNVELIGETTEHGEKIEGKDELFGGIVIIKYKHEVTFRQRVKLKSASDTVIKGKVNYMMCNSQMCKPPKDVTFEISL